MYLSPRSAASTRASGLLRAAGRGVVPAAGWLPRRGDAGGASWTSGGSGVIPGAGDVRDSMGSVVFIVATFRTRRTNPALGVGVALLSPGDPRGAAERDARGVFRLLVRREARGLSEAVAVAIHERPVIVPAVVLNDEELHRHRLRRDYLASTTVRGTASLLCCGGHGQPPLCPSDGETSPRKREELGSLSASRRYHI